MYEELLSEIGLTKSEIAVYFALLELGSSTTGPIIHKAGIASGKAYLILNKLVSKGLVTHVIQSGTKYYQATDPERLLFYLKEKEREFHEKEEELKRIIPSLKSKYEEHKYKPRAEIYEGMKGFRSFYNWLLKELKKDDCVYVLGVSGKILERFDAYLLDWNKNRIETGASMKIIYNDDAREFGRTRNKMRLTEVRYMKKDLETPAWILIYKDYVATISGYGEPVCFVIKNKEAAESYRKYFDVVWRQARN